MKYYEFSTKDYEYYALIKAVTIENAKEEYEDIVSYFTKEEKFKNPIEVNEKDVFELFSKVHKKNHPKSTKKEIKEEFELYTNLGNRKAMCILIDSNL